MTASSNETATNFENQVTQESVATFLAEMRGIIRNPQSGSFDTIDLARHLRERRATDQLDPGYLKLVHYLADLARPKSGFTDKHKLKFTDNGLVIINPQEESQTVSYEELARRANQSSPQTLLEVEPTEAETMSKKWQSQLLEAASELELSFGEPIPAEKLVTLIERLGGEEEGIYIPRGDKAILMSDDKGLALVSLGLTNGGHESEVMPRSLRNVESSQRSLTKMYEDRLREAEAKWKEVVNKRSQMQEYIRLKQAGEKIPEDSFDPFNVRIWENFSVEELEGEGLRDITGHMNQLDYYVFEAEQDLVAKIRYFRENYPGEPLPDGLPMVLAHT